MKTAYRLHCANINEMEDIYIGVIEFQTYDPVEMANYIEDMGEDNIDELYTVEEYETDRDDFVRPENGRYWYWLPTAFVNDAYSDYTIRSMSDGAVICTGITAKSESEAEDIFLDRYHNYNEDDIYASPSKWND